MASIQSSINSGFWINWESGAVNGATLTLPTNAGLILISFLTLFVQFAGGAFWRTLCFVLHQIRSTTLARDGLYHQQQVIIRNAVTAPDALMSLLRSTIVWRSRALSPFRRSAPLIFITGVHIACFAAAGLFSSQIASTKAGQALIDSSACGYPKNLSMIQASDFRTLDDQDLEVFNAQVLLGRYSLAKSSAYVKSCYSSGNKDNADCFRFVRRNLIGEQASTDMSAACPFGGDACLSKAVRFDTGLLNSNADLGINNPEKNSVQFRKVTTCAPIRAENYATKYVNNLPQVYRGPKNETTSVKFYEFGQSDTGCFATALANQTSTTTFCVSQWMKDYLTGAYYVSANTAYAEGGDPRENDFTPVQDFSIPKADVTLIGVFNKAVYKGKVDDPLFSAQTPATSSGVFYTSSNDFAVLGCTEQFQYCNPLAGKCTDLTGLWAVQKAVRDGALSLSNTQKATFAVMWDASWGMVMRWTVKLLNSNVLLASDWVFTATSPGSSALPSDQWQSESYNLHNLSLALFQHRVSQYAAPDPFEVYPGFDARANLNVPTDPDMLALCKRQRILSQTHYSVSVLGMAVILAVGFFLILLNQSIETLWFRFTHSHLAKRADWTQTSTLQLHRQALEARGIGSWDRKNQDFPILENNAKAFTGLGAREEMIGESDRSSVQYQVVTNDYAYKEQS